MLVRNLIPSQGSASTPATYDVVRPDNGVTVYKVQASTREDITKAIDVAGAALPAWSVTPLADRCAVITRAAGLLADEAKGWQSRLVESNLEETPVPEFWAREQGRRVGDVLTALVEACEAALVSEVHEHHGATIEVTREPYGVCLAMAAWNAVQFLTARAIVTPLLAGNTVVLKTSEVTPRTQLLWAELLYAAGLPEGCLAVVHVDPKHAPDMAETLISDSRIRHVNFTGSTRVGSILASLAGKYLKPTIMELGGKAPTLILPDADLVAAASTILLGAWLNNGQICMSTERVYVPEPLQRPLFAEFETAWRNLDNKEPRSTFTHASADRVRALVGQAVDKGASLLFDAGTSNMGKGASVPPLVVSDVTQDMSIASEETFGPVVVIIAVPDGEDMVHKMVAMANDSPYGLSASVWGRDVEAARKVARRLEAGAVHINSSTVADPPGVPHGGWKSSGWGRFNGIEGLRSFTQTRSIEYSSRPPGVPPLNVLL